MMKKMLGTAAIGLLAVVTIVAGAYMAAGARFALVVAVVLSVLVGATIAAEYFTELTRKDLDELQERMTAAPVYVGGVTMHSDGLVVVDGDMPEELKGLLGIGTSADIEPPIVGLMRRLAERGPDHGTIEPILDCEGSLVDFNIVPEHGLSDRELREVEDKWGA